MSETDVANRVKCWAWSARDDKFSVHGTLLFHKDHSNFAQGIEVSGKVAGIWLYWSRGWRQFQMLIGGKIDWKLKFLTKHSEATRGPFLEWARYSMCKRAKVSLPWQFWQCLVCLTLFLTLCWGRDWFIRPSLGCDYCPRQCDGLPEEDCMPLWIHRKNSCPYQTRWYGTSQCIAESSSMLKWK